ncbi:MAG: GNAT family N-acetyltransferase [Thermoplasmata archaeon]|nr:MAG: GNAT family N-acetyltransferase [Thermoplasmata archaeon]
MVKLRNAISEDLEEINNILFINGQIGDVVEEDIKWVIVAEDEGEVVGCGMLKDHEDSVEIRKVSVLPDTRGKGVGKEIVLRLLVKAKGRSCWLTSVESHNFWEFFGFVAVTEEEEPRDVIEHCRRCTRRQECNRVVMVRDVE